METIERRNDITGLHELLLEMLLDIDAVCKRHEIPYLIAFGSMIGAVRHSGFIPWDDDVDLIMMRSDYERFLSVAEQEMDHDRYFVQKEMTKEWSRAFSKIRRNGTTFIESDMVPETEHQGCFVDIMPCDNLSVNRFVAKLQWIAAQSITAKTMRKRGFRNITFKERMLLFLSALISTKRLHAFVIKRQLTDSPFVHCFFCCTHMETAMYPREHMTEIMSHEFEGYEVPISKHYDAHLRQVYGDYMQLPPEKARLVAIHARVFDLNKDYREYLRGN